MPENIRTRRILKWTAGIAGGLIVLFALLLAFLTYFITGDFVKGKASSRASDRMGREFTIAGPVDIDWHWTTPTIRASEIRLANAPEAKEPYMLEIARLDARVKMWKLLFGKVELPELALQRPRIILERYDEKNANWRMPGFSEGDAVADAALPDDRHDFPIIHRLRLYEGKLVYRDAPRKLDLDLALDTARGTSGGEQEQFRLSGKGTLEEQAFNLRAKGGSLEMLRDTGKPFPLAFELTMGPTKVVLNGTFTDPVKMQGIDATLDLQGNNLADLFYLTGIPLPPTPPYNLSGQLGKKDETWSYRKFSGKVGDSDLAGNLAYDTGKERNYLEADLTSKRLDVDDLGGFIGLAPSTRQGETAAPEQKKQAQQQAARPTVLPDVPIRLNRLRAADMDVTLTAAQLHAPGWPLRDAKAHFNLRQGVLKIDPLRFAMADGAVAGNIVLDGRKETPDVSTALDLRNLNLNRFFNNTRFEETSAGIFGGKIKLSGHGNSLARALGNSNGEITMMMADGVLSLLLVEAAGVDISEAVPLFFGEDQATGIRCAVADFGVEQGLLSSRAFVFDTTDTNITGLVHIDLRNEALEARLEANPKDMSLVNLQTDIVVGGTLKNPEIGLEPIEATARGAAAVILGAVLTPLAALIPLVELGEGEDSNCRSLLNQAAANAKS